MIDPCVVAFDIDGVVADTMSLFFEIAEKEYNISGIKHEDVTSYNLEDCLDVDNDLMVEIFTRIINGEFSSTLKPISGAPQVLNKIAEKCKSLLFVTARPHKGDIINWLSDIIGVKPEILEVETTGSFEGKIDVLLNNGFSYILEDRFETCELLIEAGITPILYKQPWNNREHSFIEVNGWKEFEKLLNI